MIDWFLSGGVVMWPLLILAVAVTSLAARAALQIRRAAARAPGHASPETVRRSLGTMIFWGAAAFLLGALGTVVGIVIMARTIAVAGSAGSMGLVWGGIGVTLVSLMFGILIFLGSGLLWLALDTWSRRLPTPSMVADA